MIPDNYFLKSRYEYSPELTLEGQFIYSPYRSEQQPDNSINSLNINHSDGLSSYLALNGINMRAIGSTKFLIKNPMPVVPGPVIVIHGPRKQIPLTGAVITIVRKADLVIWTNGSGTAPTISV